MRDSSLPFARAWPVIAALAIVGLARSGFYHLRAEGPPAAAALRLDDRYRALAALLPPGRIGYLTDLPVDVAPTPQQEAGRPGSRLYQEALFALAPRVLVLGEDRTARVLAQVARREELFALARAHRLRVVAELALPECCGSPSAHAAVLAPEDAP